MAHTVELATYVGNSESTKPSHEAHAVSEVSQPHLVPSRTNQ